MNLNIRSNGETRSYNIASQGNPSPTADAASAGSLYEVQNGDSMWSIWKGQAKDNGTSWADFKSANSHIFNEPHKGEGIWKGDKVVIPNADKIATAKASSAESETIKKSEGVNKLAAAKEGETRLNPATGELFTIGGPKVNDELDVHFGKTEGATVKDFTGTKISDDMNVYHAGIKGNATLVEAKGALGDPQTGTGVKGRVGVEVDAQLGGHVASKYNGETGEFAASSKVGAYTGVDAVAEGEAGLFGWFGVGGKVSKGVGAGASAEAHIQNEDGRAEAGLFAKGGLGITAGTGLKVWVDHGKIGRDLGTAKDAVVDTVKGWGNGIANFFGSIDLGSNNNSF